MLGDPALTTEAGARIAQGVIVESACNIGCCSPALQTAGLRWLVAPSTASALGHPGLRAGAAAEKVHAQGRIHCMLWRATNSNF